MNFKEVEKVAREKFNGSCKVCKVCNGIACAGEVPGMGGKGSGSSFIDNRKSLEKIKINMRVIHNVSNQILLKNYLEKNGCSNICSTYNWNNFKYGWKNF